MNNQSKFFYFTSFMIALQWLILINLLLKPTIAQPRYPIDQLDELAPHLSEEEKQYIEQKTINEVASLLMLMMPIFEVGGGIRNVQVIRRYRFRGEFDFKLEARNIVKRTLAGKTIELVNKNNSMFRLRKIGRFDLLVEEIYEGRIVNSSTYKLGLKGAIGSGYLRGVSPDDIIKYDDLIEEALHNEPGSQLDKNRISK
ncbi:MAG: hypothetical protein DSM106950_33390 [Stigonema ocellatum SAG 48.90 = DSM 106950]|nr:hypothetical protein [Stigonema ocellatum SAG 48.90 = DSM 106950]